MQKTKKKILLGVLISLGVIAVLLTVFFSIVFQSHRIIAGVGVTDAGHMTTLGDIEGISAADPRLVDIAMIGAHGATSADIKYDGKMSPKDSGGPLGKLRAFIGGASYRFAKAQTVGIKEQLSAGARFFQIKCCYVDGRWWGEHSLISEPLEDYILPIIEFLSTTTGEIVIPQFEPTYVGEACVADMHDFIASVKYEGKSLMDFVYYDAVNALNLESWEGVTVGELRYNDLTRNGTASGVVLFEDYTVDGKVLPIGYSPYNKYYFAIDYYSSSVWHSRMGTKTLLKEIDKTACDIREHMDEYADLLRINQTQGSFSMRDPFQMIGGWSLIDFANKHNPKVLDDKRFDDWLEVMPIALFDYVTCDNKDFNSRLNQKIRAYNERLVQTALTAAQ